MAQNMTWQQIRDGGEPRDLGQLDVWFGLIPLWQWAGLADDGLKRAIEERARSLGKPFTVDHAMRMLEELGDEARALGQWLELQSFAGASRLRTAIEGFFAEHADAPAKAAPKPTPREDEPGEGAPKPEQKREEKKEEKREAAPKAEEKKDAAPGAKVDEKTAAAAKPEEKRDAAPGAKVEEKTAKPGDPAPAK